jgi:hypothetical protein
MTAVDVIEKPFLFLAYPAEVDDQSPAVWL